MSTALNATCPCGSGKKYKRCCYAEDAQSADQARSKAPKLLVGLGLVAALGSYFVHQDLRTSTLIAVGSAVAALAYWGFSDPPPPRSGSGDPAGMNFGR